MNGVWTCNISFNKGISAGDWFLNISVLDSAGHQSNYKALTSREFEYSSSMPETSPAINLLSGGVVTVISSTPQKPAQVEEHPFSLTGEFGVGGYAEVWPSAIANKSITVQWFADGIAISNQTRTRLALSESYSGKTLGARISVAANGYRTKVVDLLANHPVGPVIADDYGSAGWLYPDGVQHNLSRPFCFEPQASSSLGTPRVGWKIETYCPYTTSPSFGFPTGKKFYWYSGASPREITSQGTYRIRYSDVNRGLFMAYEEVWANGFWTSGVEKFASQIKATLVSTRPSVSGRITLGSRLTAKPGAWQKGSIFKYQWFRDYSPIEGAVASTYLVTAADLGKPINVMVTGTLSGFNPSTKISLPVSSGVYLAPDVESIYRDATASYVPSGEKTVTDVHVSPSVDPISLSVDSEILQKAADFWNDQFDGRSVRIIFVSAADSNQTWIDDLFREHSTWGSATTIRQKIAANGCGWAYANLGSVVQCVPESTSFNDSDRQVMAHEYTHLVQYGWDSYNFSMSVPWMVEGMANFYGLALGVSSREGGIQTINKSLAGHATQLDLFNGYPWGTFKSLSIIGGQDTEDSRLLFRKGADLWTNYMLGTLFSEWSIKTIGHENYAQFVRDLLRIRAERFDIGNTDLITERYYGLTLDELSYAVAPYFEQRSIQLRAAWPK